MPALAFTLTASPIKKQNQTQTEIARSSRSAISTAKADENRRHLRAVPSAERSDVHDKPKRSRFSDKHGSEGSRLAELLREKRKEFPSYRAALDALIKQVVKHSERTRKSDRDKVLNTLREWSFGLTYKEIAEDTGLSHWDVRMVLSELLKAGRITAERELRAGAHSKQWCVIYRVK
jgi:O6-methylguanine-DNA--protein-cysteine methyltransferase